MQTRKLGQSNIHTPPLIIGGNVFGWTLDEAASFRMLDEYVDAGLNVIDTADVYGRTKSGGVGYESENIIGRWMRQRGNRDRVIIATKLGMQLAPDKKGLSRAYIFRAIEDSLQRLQTDYIDLYQSHTDDADTPLEETLQAYGELIRQGKVRAIGASNYTGARLAAALEVAKREGLPRYESIQPLYNLYDRAGFENDLEGVCKQYGIGVIPYFPLASGFLSGKYRSKQDIEGKPRARIVERYLTPRGEQILRALEEVATANNSTMAAVAVAWLIAQPSVTAPIASVTSSAQLQNLVEAIALKLDQTSLAKLDRASSG